MESKYIPLVVVGAGLAGFAALSAIGSGPKIIKLSGESSSGDAELKAKALDLLISREERLFARDERASERELERERIRAEQEIGRYRLEVSKQLAEAQLSREDARKKQELENQAAAAERQQSSNFWGGLFGVIGQLAPSLIGLALSLSDEELYSEQIKRNTGRNYRSQFALLGAYRRRVYET